MNNTSTEKILNGLTEKELLALVKKRPLPKHIAFIVDGNRRWAKKNGLNNIKAYEKAAVRVREISLCCLDLNIEFLTFFAFSTENMSRPKKEIDDVIITIKRYLKREKKTFKLNKVKFKIIGRIEKIPISIRKLAKNLESETSCNTRMTILAAMSYGGRAEIVDGINNLLMDYETSKKHRKKFPPVSVNSFRKYLYTNEIRDPDLIIRTGGEIRISNFLLWQSAYTELYFTPIFWPDFEKKYFFISLLDFQSRNRRYGL